MEGHVRANYEGVEHGSSRTLQTTQIESNLFVFQTIH
jgi:hypothetical protein